MADNGWQVIGRVARDRRERLGLKQDELAQYGGPGVSTVGKFERAAQENFPLRTQHQMERALGWRRGTIEEFVRAVGEDPELVEEWSTDLIEDDVPDMSRPLTPPEEDGSTVEAVQALASVFRLVPDDRRDAALHAALGTLLRFLDVSGATQLGRGLAHQFKGGGGDAEESRGPAPMKPALSDVSDTPDLEIAALDEEGSISAEQESSNET